MSPPFPWAAVEPNRLVGKGHTAGDFLEAWAWEVLDEERGFLRVQAHMPDAVLNPRGQLFGGFTPAYVDLVALFTAQAGPDRLNPERPWRWLVTNRLQVEYFEPIMGPTFVMEGRLDKSRGRVRHVTVRFLQDGELAVLAAASMLEMDPV